MSAGNATRPPPARPAPPTASDDAPGPSLALSVAWGYAAAFVLLAVVFLVLLPDADGPSPWDGAAFRSAILELAANFRLLDELADMGLVRVADVGTGLLTVDLDLIGVSNRRFGWAPFLAAVTLVSLSLLLRGLRQRLLAHRAGLPHEAPGQTSSYFLGRGMNLFFPFGPGDLATARVLDGGDGTGETARDVVFHNRVFELLGILVVLTVALVWMGWGGAITSVAWTLFLVAATVSLTRPLGWSGGGPAGWNLVAGLWRALNGPDLVRAVVRLASSPGFLTGVVLLSTAALFIEVLGYWWLKQAFSSPLDDYVLMKDLGFVPFAVVAAVAAVTRIIPYTFASLGVYEIVSVIMFRVQGEGWLSATTVTLLDSLLLNALTLAFFLVAMRAGPSPSILETWQMFYRRSQRPAAEASSP